MAVRNVTDAELLEARERADAGIRLALPQFAERLGLIEKPAAEAVPLDPALAELVASDLGEAREPLIKAMVLLDANREQEGMGELHVRVGQLVNAIDDMAALLSRELGS